MRPSRRLQAAALESLDLVGVARYMQSGACKSAIVMTGAGIANEWRDLYGSLRGDLITASVEQAAKLKENASAVMGQALFLDNPFPYLELRRPFILGTQRREWKASLSHWFVKFLQDERMLLRAYAQNVDAMGEQTGVAPERLFNVHGSMGEAACAVCGAKADFATFCDEVRTKIKDVYGMDPEAPAESSHIFCRECGKPAMKPATVLFGGAMPAGFSALAKSDLPKADLFLLAGTSLTAAPANKMVRMLPLSCPRLVVSPHMVGEDHGFDFSPSSLRDVFAGGRSCDETMLELMRLLGWQDKLLAVKERLPVKSQLLMQSVMHA